eukprot:TRINITY_DN5156_c0_g1_i2.p1 TRINITY_DN5156_c0_g1~~TRINITY_DN5156_c0_g1_i2.p1  ORF type:complete len:355 (-),score=77.74 TRINITY_DN5156_c0_g1_i2:222-1286(-)
MCIRDRYMGNQKNQMTSSNADVVFKGFLQGHRDWVTSIVAGHSLRENEDSPILVSGSRDKSVMIWRLDPESAEDHPQRLYGTPYRQLTGHNHFVSDLALSNDNSFCLSSSWDKTMRLWDLRAGVSTRTFFGHTGEVLSCCFSADNRQIFSTGTEKTIKLWNVNAECKYTSDQGNHNDWVSQIRYSPSSKVPYFATVGWDGRLKIWNTQFSIKYSFKAHTQNINALCISPFGNYIATGGKDSTLKIWNFNDLEAPNNQYETGATINAICFNPKMQWIAIGTENGVKIWDLYSDNETPIANIVGEPFKKVERTKRSKAPSCTSLTWNALGNKLYAGFNDGYIRVYHVLLENSKQNE